MAGRFNYSVDMTDVATQWTEILVALTNRGDAIAARLEEGRDRMRKTQDGHRWRKVFEKAPKTPAQRVLENPSVPEPCKDRVRVLLARNDPLELLRRGEAAKRRLQRVQARLAGACPSSVVPAGGGSSLRSAPPGTPPASGDDGQPCVGITVAASARNERLAPLTTDAHASVTPNMAQPGNHPSRFR